MDGGNGATRTAQDIVVTTGEEDKSGRGLVEEAPLQRAGRKNKRVHRAIKHAGVTREEPMWQKSK